MAEVGPPWVEVNYPRAKASLQRLYCLVCACNSLCGRRCRRDVLSGRCFILRCVCCGLGRNIFVASSGLTLGQKCFQDQQGGKDFSKRSWVMSSRCGPKGDCFQRFVY